MKVDQGLVNQVLEAARMLVTEGLGEGRPAHGFSIIVGKANEILGDEGTDAERLDIKPFRQSHDLRLGDCLSERKRLFLNLFHKEGAIVVDSLTGQVRRGGFCVNAATASISTGRRRKAASAVATQANGCYVVIASETICGSIEKPVPLHAKLKVFDGEKAPQEIPVRVSAEVREFAVEQWLRPLKFGAELRPYNEEFIEGTRDWIFDDIEAWRRNVSGSRCLVLLAGPGFGKTAIAARLHLMTTRVLAIHLCRYNESSTRDRRHMITSIAYQIAEVLPQFRDALRRVYKAEGGADAHVLQPTVRELADYLLFQPLSEIAPPEAVNTGGRHVIIIDALDEAEHDSKNDLLDLITLDFRKLPPWVALLVTARPEANIRKKLALLRPTVLDAEAYKDKCDVDVRVYLRRILSPRFKTYGSVDRAIDAIATKSEGLFLYLHCIRDKLTSADDIDSLPIGLHGLYEKQLERMLGPAGLGDENSQTRRVVEAIIAAQVPVHVHNELPGLSGVRQDTVCTLLSRLSSVFPVRADDHRVYIFHKSFADWLTSDKRIDQESNFVVDRCSAHRRLAFACSLPLIRIFKGKNDRLESDAHAVNVLKQVVKTCGCIVYDSRKSLVLKEYALRWSVTHFFEAKGLENVSLALLHSLRFLTKRAAQMDTLIADAALLLPTTALLHRALVLARSHVRLCGAQWLAEELWQRLLGPAQACGVINLERLTRDARQKARATLMFSARHAFLTPADSTGQCVLEEHSCGAYGGTAFVDAEGRTRVANCTRDNTICIWNSIYGGHCAVLSGHFSYINCVTAFVDAKGYTWVVSCSSDRTVRIWEPYTCDEAVHELMGHSNEVNGVTVFVDAEGHWWVASCSTDATIRIWDPIEGEALHVLDGHSRRVNVVTAFAAAKGHTWLASCSEDATVRIWDPIKDTKAVHVLEGHSAGVRSVTAFENAKGDTWVASCSNDGTVRVWDPIAGGDAVRVLEGHANMVKDVIAFVDAKGHTWVASCSKDKTVRIWDPINSGEPVHVLRGHRDDVNGMAAFVDPQGHTMMATCSRDKTVRFWDPINGGEEIRVLEGHSNDVNGIMAVVDDGGQTFVASWSVDQTVLIWDATKGGEAVRKLEKQILTIRGVAVYEDAKGRRLVAICSAHEVRIYPCQGVQDIRRAQAVHVLEGHSDYVNGVTAFVDSKGHRWLASCAEDKTVRVWDAINGGKAVNVLEGHSSAVSGVISFVGAKGQTLVASSSMDGTVRIWNPINCERSACFVIPVESRQSAIAAISAGPSRRPCPGVALLGVGHEDGRISLLDESNKGLHNTIRGFATNCQAFLLKTARRCLQRCLQRPARCIQ